MSAYRTVSSWTESSLLFSRPTPRRTCSPVRRYLAELTKLVSEGEINPGKVSNLVLPLDRVADGYRAMDERRAIKALLGP